MNYPTYGYPQAFPGDVGYPGFGYVGGAETDAACKAMREQGAKDAAASIDPKAGVQAVLQVVNPPANMIDALAICYTEGYNAQKAETETFYKSPQGQKGLLYGALAGVVVGVIVGKVLL